MKTMQDFYSTKEVADKFGVGKVTILSWPKTVEGFPQPLRLNGRTLRWPKAAIDQFALRAETTT